jgi:hypothetical protein
MNYAPIAIFVYKRPDHTRQTIEALIHCPEFAQSPLYVFSDGAKKPEDQASINETRAVVRSIVGEKANMIEAVENQGLANSIIAGVSKLLNEYDQVIVLEDDLIVSPGFLRYMNAALEMYKNEPLVMNISGYMYPVPKFAERTEAMFLPFISSWGWATWRRSWEYFDPQAGGWEILQSDKETRSRFDLNDSFDYSDMLEKQMAGKLDSWAIRWYWSVFKNHGLTLFPPVSHVKNIGFDGSGSHGSLSARLLYKSDNKCVSAETDLPATIVVDSADFKTVQEFRGYRRKGLSVLRNIKNSIVSIFTNSMG